MADAALCDDLAAFAAHHRAVAPRRAPAHPLVVQHAENHGWNATARPYEGRLASWANTSRVFHLTHIAKTAGRSVRLELMKVVRPVGGAEQCYPPFAHDSRVNIIFLRNPRSHLLSMYLHGAYAGRVARRRAAGYPVGLPGGDMAGFAAWLDHFAPGRWTPAMGDFTSYNPLNMMARTLTCRDERWNCDYVSSCEVPCAHHVGASAADATPPLADALAAVHTADFIGVTEALPESLCLFEYRATRALPAACRCDGAGDLAAAANVAHVRNARGQRARSQTTIGDAPPSVLRAADAVTAVDARVYRSAVLRLLCDIAALEAATGAAVLCPARLEALRRATAYIPGLWPAANATLRRPRP